MQKPRLTFHPPREWFVEGRGKPYMPATWEGWLIVLPLIASPLIASLIGFGR